MNRTIFALFIHTFQQTPVHSVDSLFSTDLKTKQSAVFLRCYADGFTYSKMASDSSSQF